MKRRTIHPWTVIGTVLLVGLAAAGAYESTRAARMARIAETVQEADFHAPLLERGRLGTWKYFVVESAPLPNGRVGQLTVLVPTRKQTGTIRRNP